MTTKNLLTFTLAVLLTASISSCKKKGCTDSAATNYDSDAKKDDGSCVLPVVVDETIDINSDPTYTFTVNGSTQTFPSDGSVSGVTGTDKNVGTTSTTATWSSSFYDNDLEYEVIGISKGIMTYPSGSLTDSQYSAYFAAGSYPYASSSSTSGISIILGDSNGNYYRSELGDQTGSTFSIVSKTDDYLGSELYVKVYATFSCKVYNTSNTSDVRTITNAEFVGHFTDL